MTGTAFCLRLSAQDASLGARNRHGFSQAVGLFLAEGTAGAEELGQGWTRSPKGTRRSSCLGYSELEEGCCLWLERSGPQQGVWVPFWVSRKALEALQQELCLERGLQEQAWSGRRGGGAVGGSHHRRCASCRGEALGRCLRIGCRSYWFHIQVAASLSLIPITHPQTGQPSSFSGSHWLAHAANKPHITLSHTLVSSVSLTSLWVLPGW